MYAVVSSKIIITVTYTRYVVESSLMDAVKPSSYSHTNLMDFFRYLKTEMSSGENILNHITMIPELCAEKNEKKIIYYLLGLAPLKSMLY